MILVTHIAQMGFWDFQSHMVSSWDPKWRQTPNKMMGRRQIAIAWTGVTSCVELFWLQTWKKLIYPILRSGETPWGCTNTKSRSNKVFRSHNGSTARLFCCSWCRCIHRHQSVRLIGSLLINTAKVRFNSFQWTVWSSLITHCLQYIVSWAEWFPSAIFSVCFSVCLFVLSCYKYTNFENAYFRK